ncbi:hypothetical protein EIP91_005693 [Steccherinum ochraceum]|uniref:Origin recognition complex subunit 5 n=1 Tax=Steccherinum ochraceum TaxID=92696 RepID=A0A4R0R757_9APHY|nr:hypothetical protein EIP91_005693 [Steccherinum ochraceum]
MATTAGYETLLAHLSTLIDVAPPPFIHVHDPHTPRISASLLRTLARRPQTSDPAFPTPHIAYACVNAVACFTPRLFYDTVLNALARWTPKWETGCENWTDDSGQRFNESVDGFVHGLRAVHSWLGQSGSSSKMSAKAKGKARDDGNAVRLVLIVERAERLKDNVPDLIVPLTRLAELAQIDLTTILHSELPWDQIRLTLGASPDPFYISVPALTKDTVATRLASTYPPLTSTSTSTLINPNTYHPAFHRLYTHFVSAVVSVCWAFVTDPDELAYVVAARWPGFVQPVVDEWEEQKRQHRRRGDEDMEVEEDVDADEQINEAQQHDREDGEDEELELTPPTEDTRLRLTRLFTPSISKALESLYPRLTSAQTWLLHNQPPSNLLSYAPQDAVAVLANSQQSNHSSTQTKQLKHQAGGGDSGEIKLEKLPRMAKFVLIAAFLASTNPAKTDMRMFGRGLDERKKRKRPSSPRKKGSAKAGAVKIPQRLLGPLTFPLDRLLAILGVLLEEHDSDVRPPMPEYNDVPGSYTETELARVAIYAQVNHLASMHLLHRASSPDRLELSPSFKCGISYDGALRLARDVDVKLHDLLWEAA